jgi:hypothetical protein
MKTMSFQIQYTSIIITYFVTKMEAFFFSSFKLFFYLFLFSFFLLNTFFPFFFFFKFYYLSQVVYFFQILFFIVIIFSLSMHILCPTFGYCTNHPKKSNQHFMLQMWVLQNHYDKTNVYFVTLMQVFHIKLYVFEVLLMQ